MRDTLLHTKQNAQIVIPFNFIVYIIWQLKIAVITE